MAELNQEIFKVTKEESELMKELLYPIRKCREEQRNKVHCSIIGKVVIKIYNNQVELEPAFYPGIKTIKR